MTSEWLIEVQGVTHCSEELFPVVGLADEPSCTADPCLLGGSI